MSEERINWDKIEKDIQDIRKDPNAMKALKEFIKYHTSQDKMSVKTYRKKYIRVRSHYRNVGKKKVKVKAYLRIKKVKNK